MKEEDKIPFFELGKKGPQSWPLWISIAVIVYAGYYVAPNIAYRLGDIITNLVSGGRFTNPMRDRYSYDLVEQIIPFISSYFLYCVPAFVAVWFAQKHLRKRPLKELLTTTKRVRWKLAVKAAIIYMFVLTLMWLMKSFFHDWGAVKFVFTSKSLLFWPAAIVLIIIFAITQEIVFRGLLCQGLASKIKSPIIVMVLSSLIYTAWAAGSIYIAFGWQSFLLTFFVYGMATCLLTAMSDGLEAAVAVSAVGGLIYTLIVSSHLEGFDPIFSVYSTGEPLYDAVSFFEEVAVMAITVILFAYALPQKKEV